MNFFEAGGTEGGGGGRKMIWAWDVFWYIFFLSDGVLSFLFDLPEWMFHIPT